MAWLRNLGFKAGVAAWQLENIPDGVALQHLLAASGIDVLQCGQCFCWMDTSTRSRAVD